MDTSTSKTTTDKIAILRGTQVVHHKDLTVEDWAELIDQLVRDYKPYLKYVHSFTVVSDHISRFRPGAKVVNQSVPNSTRITPVYQWQRSWDYIELELFLDRDGCFVIESVTYVPDPTPGSPKMGHHYELEKVLSMVRFLKYQSELAKFPVATLAGDIVRGLFQVFDRSVKHKAQMLRKLEVVRDHLQLVLTRVKY